MSEIENLKPQGWIIRRRWLPVLLIVLSSAALCIGVTGIYAGSSLTESRWDKEKLKYEQRLGTQSAEYAKNLQTFQDDLEPIARGLKQTQQDVQDLTKKFDRATIKRDQANAEAIRAARDASNKATALSDQLRTQQKVIVAKADEAVSAAKATEKKLDSATQPAAIAPAHPWGK